MKLASHYRYELAAFFSGAATLVLEMLGLNIIAPYFGTALIVQSNLLGIVLFALALGYWRGGHIADRDASETMVARVLFRIGVLITLLFSFRDAIGGVFRAILVVPSFGSFLLVTTLFFWPCYEIGKLLPLLVRALVVRADTAGQTIGRIYALSSLGSVCGALLFVFFVTPFIGVTFTLFATVLVLLYLSSTFGITHRRVAEAGVVALALFLWGGMVEYNKYFQGSVSFDGKVSIDRNALVKLDDASTPYSRIQIFEGIELKSRRPIRFININRETHSGTFLDSNELVFHYTQFNRLGGHFNPMAKKALLIGGGGYSYANYFLGDTPLYDREKVWSFFGKKYSNNKTVSLPIIASSRYGDRIVHPKVIFMEDSFPEGRAQVESEHNHIEADNQLPGSVITVKSADIEDTGFAVPEGYVHVHEVDKNGLPGKVISEDAPIVPKLIIGHSRLLSGKNYNIEIKLDRAVKDGEILYVMLHRDNGNKVFDPILVDGYEQIEKLDVVEIDKQTTEFAKKYFHLNTADPRLRIFHEDGRTYINRSADTYDIIYLDAFRSFYSVPYQLTTKEAVEKVFHMLNDHGVVVVNMPSVLSGEYGRFFQSEYHTYSTIFPHVKIFAVTDPKREDILQNIVMIAFKDATPPRDTPNADDDINAQLMYEWKKGPDPKAPILTDDYAPVDYFIDSFANAHTF